MSEMPVDIRREIARNTRKTKYSKYSGIMKSMIMPGIIETKSKLTGSGPMGYIPQFAAELAVLHRRGIDRGINQVLGVLTDGTRWVFGCCKFKHPPDDDVLPSERRSLHVEFKCTDAGMSCHASSSSLHAVYGVHPNVMDAVAQDLACLVRAMRAETEKAIDRVHGWMTSRVYGGDIHDIWETGTEPPESYESQEEEKMLGDDTLVDDVFIDLESENGDELEPDSVSQHKRERTNTGYTKTKRARP